MRSSPRVARLGALLFVTAVALPLSSCASFHFKGESDCDDACHDHAKVCRHPSMMALARDLDALEAHIEQHGSVVAMQPSVWGEARLTRHRDEVEKEMAKDLTGFKESLQGSLFRSDQAYLANALSLGVAVSGQAAGVRAPRVVVNSSTAAAASSEKPTPLAVPVADIPGDPFAVFKDISRTKIVAPTALGFAEAGGKLSLEPTVVLDQKFRYLNHLNELRRINEGDDTADSPGYSLNLIRVPVSVLPGKRTREGYAAEITMTLKPYLSDELLPTTFRNLVMNDLVNQIGVPLTAYLNDPDTQGALKLFLELTPQARQNIRMDKLKKEDIENIPEPMRSELLKKATDYVTSKGIILKKDAKDPDGWKIAAANYWVKKKITSELTQKLSRTIPVTKVRRAFLPFAPSQMLEVYGDELASDFVLETFARLTQSPASTSPCDPKARFLHLPDVQGYLQEEIAAAYRFLSNPTTQELWNFCTPELAHAVRARRSEVIDVIRNNFVVAAGPIRVEGQEKATTVALAWAIIVESALLNERLIQDMKEAAVARGCACPTDGWLPYFLPCPPPEARQAFNQYVACRWPVHVFALDPVKEQQNIADTFARRREMQLALSLAFVSGQISARNMTNYARRVEHNMETIDLNGTAVGFAHGPDTFGWRFYPRFQTPDIEGNLTVVARDLLIGGPSRDADLRQRRLEPGTRECIAVVLMPSFVPYATVDVGSNFFALANPKCKAMDLTHAMRLSKSVKTIERCVPQVGDADCYRDGDFMRLLQRAKQLEARLPLQSMTVQIPYENTLGGFAMFNSGITDLAPELTGWYGAPTINLDASTTLFLVGDHFSVHDTKVIAGGQPVEFQLLSRQVMRAVVPKGTRRLDTPQGTFVDVHVATPYGVTPHLLIPVCVPKAAPAPAAGVAWTTTALDVSWVYLGNGLGIESPKLKAKEQRFDPLELTLKGDEPLTRQAKKADLLVEVGSSPEKAEASYVLRGASVSGTRITVPETEVASFVNWLFQVFGPAYRQGTNPPTTLTVSVTTVQFKSVSADNREEIIPGDRRASNALTVRWIAAPPKD